jgi:hypothetical protein
VGWKLPDPLPGGPISMLPPPGQKHLIGQPVYTDDHRGRYVGRLKVPAPLRDQLTVTGEHDCLGRVYRDVHRDLSTTVVLERLGDELSRYRVSTRRFRRCFGPPAPAVVWSSMSNSDL